MKKKILLILLVALISLAFVACSGSTANTNVNIKEVGQKYINDFFNKNFDNLVSGYNYTNTMKKQITSASLSQTYDAIIAETGNVVSYGEIQQKTESGYQTVYQIVTFEKIKLEVNVFFDKKNAIAGFNIQSAD
ncbi:MAG: DUF3887 domain-containing protein [Eubacteriaceae bacterium]|nr:DUF3887 domain-containing protein [Eubacteriaceae bacterium]